MFYRPCKLDDGKDGLKIEILPSVLEKVIALIKKDDPSIPNEDILATINRYLQVKIVSWPDLCGISINVWKEKLDTVERIFSMLSDDEIALFIYNFIDWHYWVIMTLDNLDKETDQTNLLHKLCINVSQSIIELDEKIRLFDRVTEYGKSLRIIDNPDIGKREQDSPELTFFIEDMRAVCSIAIVSKIFLPLFAAMITGSKKQGEVRNILIEGLNKYIPIKSKIVDTKAKEAFCLEFIEPLLKKHIPYTYEKAYNYIQYFVLKFKRKVKDNECSDIFMNNTLYELTKNVTATVICKKYNCISLYFQCNNIMGITKYNASKRVKAIEQGNHTKAFFVRSIAISGEEDDSVEAKSQLEVDSIYCERLYDYEPIVDVIYDYTVDKYLNKYKIPVSQLETLTAYNEQNLGIIEYHIPLFLSSVFAEDFGSCETSYILNQMKIISLISLLQIIGAKKGYNDLVHRLSATMKKVDNVFEKQEIHPESHAMILNSDEYCKNISNTLLPCKTRLVINDKNRSLSKEIKTRIKELATYFAHNTSYYRTHPMLCDIMQQPRPSEDIPIFISGRLLEQYCHMLEETL